MFRIGLTGFKILEAFIHVHDKLWPLLLSSVRSLPSGLSQSSSIKPPPLLLRLAPA